METVYLANGQACYLKEQIGARFIVNKVFEYEDGNGYSDVTHSEDVVVDEIFPAQPIEKISSEIKELESKKKEVTDALAEIEKEKRTVQRELENLKASVVSEGKFVINRSQLKSAKTITMFPKTSITPIVIDGSKTSMWGLKMHTEIEIGSGQERAWGYKLYEQGGFSSGEYLCDKYPFLVDATADEVEAMTIKRASELTFSEWAISRTEDKYLTAEQLGIKQTFLRKEQEKEREKLMDDIDKAQRQLDILIEKQRNQ